MKLLALLPPMLLSFSFNSISCSFVPLANSSRKASKSAFSLFDTADAAAAEVSVVSEDCCCCLVAESNVPDLLLLLLICKAELVVKDDVAGLLLLVVEDAGEPRLNDSNFG